MNRVETDSVPRVPTPGTEEPTVAVRLRRSLVAQFGQPQGFWGRIAGLVMAHRPSNRERSLWTLELLDLQPSDRVLEIGFGPGVAIEHAASRTAQGTVVGIDHSETMVRAATRRNATAICNQRVRLFHGSVDALPRLAHPFDKIFAVNVFGFWEKPDETLRRLRDLLAPQGCLAITFQPRAPGATDATSLSQGEQIASRFRSAGFAEVSVETRAMKPVAAVCVIGRR